MSEFEVNVLRAQVQLLAEAHELANQALRSAWEVAEREGRRTNWPAFRATLSMSLDASHATMDALRTWRDRPSPAASTVALRRALPAAPEAVSVAALRLIVEKTIRSVSADRLARRVDLRAPTFADDLSLALSRALLTTRPEPASSEPAQQAQDGRGGYAEGFAAGIEAAATVVDTEYAEKFREADEEFYSDDRYNLFQVSNALHHVAKTIRALLPPETNHV